MEELAEFNKELSALLDKYGYVLTIEDVPATKKIAVAKREVTGTDTQVASSEATGTNEPKE